MLDFYYTYNYSHGFVVLTLILGKKEEQILGSICIFLYSNFCYKNDKCRFGSYVNWNWQGNFEYKPNLFFHYSLSHISFFHHADLSHFFLLGHPGIKERFYVSKYIEQLVFFIYWFSRLLSPLTKKEKNAYASTVSEIICFSVSDNWRINLLLYVKFRTWI